MYICRLFINYTILYLIITLVAFLYFRKRKGVVPAAELPVRKREREREVKIVFIRTSFSTIFIK